MHTQASPEVRSAPLTETTRLNSPDLRSPDRSANPAPRRRRALTLLASSHTSAFLSSLVSPSPRPYILRLSTYKPPPLSTRIRSYPSAQAEKKSTQPNDPHHPSFHPTAASPRSPSSAKIATKGHKQRTSLLGGSSGTTYQPLTGSFSSSNRAYTDPYAPGAYPAGGYHDRQGLVSNAAATRESRSKMYLPSSKWTWAFALVALFQALVCLGLEAYVFGEFEASLMGEARSADPPPQAVGALTIPTYLAIFIFGFIYQLVLVWDALRLKNTIQVIGICLYNLGMMVYAAVQMDQVREAVAQLGPANIDTSTWTYLNPCLIATPCVIALGTVLLSFIAWKLYDEFAWTIYKHISADLRLKKRYLNYQVHTHTPHPNTPPIRNSTNTSYPRSTSPSSNSTSSSS